VPTKIRRQRQAIKPPAVKMQRTQLHKEAVARRQARAELLDNMLLIQAKVIKTKSNKDNDDSNASSTRGGTPR
jgi:hypothetical protein